MTRPRLKKLIRYRLFRNWWARELKKRPNKLVDLSTRLDMTIDKRLMIEKPNFDDLCKFLLDCNITQFDISYSFSRESFRCEVFNENPAIRIEVFENTPLQTIEKAILQFLETKTGPKVA